MERDEVGQGIEHPCLGPSYIWYLVCVPLRLLVIKMERTPAIKQSFRHQKTSCATIQKKPTQICAVGNSPDVIDAIQSSYQQN